MHARAHAAGAGCAARTHCLTGRQATWETGKLLRGGGVRGLQDVLIPGLGCHLRGGMQLLRWRLGSHLRLGRPHPVLQSSGGQLQGSVAASRLGCMPGPGQQGRSRRRPPER